VVEADHLVRRVVVPTGSPTRSGGALSVADFACFQSSFVEADPQADCNTSGVLTIADFACFQTAFLSWGVRRGLRCPATFRGLQRYRAGIGRTPALWGLGPLPPVAVGALRALARPAVPGYDKLRGFRGLRAVQNGAWAAVAAMRSGCAWKAAGPRAAVIGGVTRMASRGCAAH
jgi:hypothetical protein